MEANFRNAAGEASKVDAFLGYQQIGSALALAGFTLFNAHPDNVKAATLSGGIGAVGSSQLKPEARTKIYIDSTQALMCVHSIGSRFLTSQSLDGPIVDGLNALTEGRQAVALYKSKAPEVAAETTTALDALAAQIEASSAVEEARNGVSYKIEDMMLTIDSTAERLLKASAPDIAGIVDALTNLGGVQEAQSPVDAAASQSIIAAGTLASKRVDQAIVDLNIIKGDAIAKTAALKQASRGPGPAEIERMGKCIKSFD